MKILVRGTNWIGDAVMSIPALREIRRIFPNDRITLHTRTWADGIFQDASFIDEIVTYDKNRWRIKDVLDNSKFLKGDQYDLAILFPNSFESALTTFLSKIPRRIGYNKDGRGLLLTDPIAVPEWKGRRHEAFYYLDLVANVERLILGRETVNFQIPNGMLEVSGERRSETREKLAAFGVDLTKKIVALGVGSTNSRAKRWPAKSYAELADRLASTGEFTVVLVGSNDEVDVAHEVVVNSRSAIVNVVGNTDLAEATAILSEADLLIANDMGLAHLAPAVGTKTLVIFGPTDPETTRPFSKNSVVISANVDCAPCMLRDCPIDHRCMTLITPGAVFTRVLEIFTPNELADE